jgi:hypothetical protein
MRIASQLRTFGKSLRRSRFLVRISHKTSTCPLKFSTPCLNARFQLNERMTSPISNSQVWALVLLGAIGHQQSLSVASTAPVSAPGHFSVQRRREDRGADPNRGEEKSNLATIVLVTFGLGGSLTGISYGGLFSNFP